MGNKNMNFMKILKKKEKIYCNLPKKKIVRNTKNKKKNTNPIRRRKTKKKNKNRKQFK